MPPEKTDKIYSRPVVSFLLILCLLSVVEFMILGLLSQLPGLSIFAMVVVNILVLSITFVPVLYGIFLRPLRQNIISLKQSNKKITQHINKVQELGHTGTWEFDLKRNKLVWDDEVYRIFRIPIGLELSAEIFYEVVHPDDRKYVERNWRAALTGKVCDIEHRLIIDDEIRWVREIIEMELDADGTAVKAIGFTQDITEIKLLQKKAIRTAQLASAGELATMVAHEVNNPLSGVIGYAQVFSNEVCGDCHNKKLPERIIKEGDRIAKIIGGLLTFSYDSDGKKSLQEIEPIIYDALALMSSQIKKKGIRLDVELTAGLPRVKCNSQQIGQVILNIVRNAYQALLEGVLEGNIEKVIKVEAESVDNAHQEFVQISITNNGPNIPARLIEKINEPFFTTKPAGSGVGLGLSISNDIMKTHDGMLEIRSEPGDYTEMVLSLPVG